MAVRAVLEESETLSALHGSGLVFPWVQDPDRTSIRMMNFILTAIGYTLAAVFIFGFIVAAPFALLDSLSRVLKDDKCRHCRAKLKVAGSGYASTCSKCGKGQ